MNGIWNNILEHNYIVYYKHIEDILDFGEWSNSISRVAWGGAWIPECTLISAFCKCHFCIWKLRELHVFSSQNYRHE